MKFQNSVFFFPINNKWVSLWSIIRSSVIRQKGESQNGGNEKAKHAKFFEKQTFLTPWYTHIRVRIGKGGG